MKLLYKQILFLIILISLFLLHTPFLNSDPDINISTSAGPFTDEGLYTANIRNFIINNDYDFKFSDVPVKSPVFPWLFYPSFKLFGINLSVARLTVLIVVLAIYFLTFVRNKKMIIPATILLPVVFFQYYIFNFSHYALSEIIAMVIMLTAIAVTDRLLIADKPAIAGILSSLIIFTIWLLKLNFIYLTAVFPVAFLYLQTFSKKNKDFYKQAFLYSAGTAVIIFIIYYVFWVVPNKDLLFNILKEQSKNKFVSIIQIPGNAFLILKAVLFSNKLMIFSLIFLISLIIFILDFRFFIHSVYKNYFVFLIFWLIIESHKFTMNYLPTRYFIPVIFPMMVFSFLVIFVYYSKKQNPHQYIMPALIGAIIFVNSFFYLKSYQNRDYKIYEIGKIISNKCPDKAVGLGNWSSSLSWQTKARTLPVIQNSFNDSAVINKFQPDFIAIRNYTPDIMHFNKYNNIDLIKDSKSIDYYTIGRFNIVVFWLDYAKKQKSIIY